ncbi:MAG TPA: transketolase [Chloroflexota bacterium]|nr:transketolase [Chloroflexota bacterium]
MAIQAVAGARATELDALCVNTIRMLAVDGVQKAKSGHPGAPMGMAPMAYVLWTRFLKHNPLDSGWPDRDRFVLSAGHASMLLYALLHLTGYELSLEELKSFRQWGSLTPGHPEVGLTPGVETTTGPLGQGFANGVGMAIAERHLAARFNRPGHDLVDHHTYAIVSDGDLQEGVASEAASLAGRLKLGKLIYLYDSNGIQIEGSTALAFTERVDLRFEAYGWHVQRVEDGNDLDAIEEAIRRAQAETERPSLIIVTTTIAYGSPNKAGTASAHGEPLGEDEVRATKEALGWPLEPTFLIPEEALAHLRKAREDGPSRQAEWNALLQRCAADHPEDAASFARWMAGELPEGWDAGLPAFKSEDGAVATRAASGKLLAALAGRIENLIGGSADLAPSTQTYLKQYPDLAPPDYAGRNLRFGVREHAMGSIANGIALHGGLIPYTGTFLIFSDYMRPAIRLAALSHAKVVFVFTHDSIGLGEDGPTHQPIEQLMSLRLIPGLVVLRPADAAETVEAWRHALQHHGPTAILLSRQGLPVFDRTSLGEAGGVQRGAYILARESGAKPDLVLMGSGSEVSLLMEARARLEGRGVAARVVSMPSWELFDLQPREYRDSVLPPEMAARLAVEAGVPVGWCRYVGDRGSVLGIERFGASAPAKVIFEQLKFTAERVAQEGMRLLGRT